jgi:hypothetical protein
MAVQPSSHSCSAGFSLLLHECVDEFDDEQLLAAGQDGRLLEGALKLSDVPGAARGCERRWAEQVFDAHTEGFGELWQDVWTRRLGCGFPKADAGLGHAERSSELSLAESSRFTKSS